MIVTIRLPLCDKCGEIWLPRKDKTRNKPERTDRCSKCKSPDWNRSARAGNKMTKEDHDRLCSLLRDNSIAIEDSSLPTSIPANVPVTGQVNTWAPILKGSDKPTERLRVPCGTQAPTNGAQYRELLQDRLHELISTNPAQAKRDLQMMESTEIPALLPMLRGTPSKHWAVNIALSDQTTMLLGEIDWQKICPVQELSEEDLPILLDYLELI